METVHQHFLFTALTRPPMCLGVTLDYLSISVILALCGMIAANNVAYLLLYIPLHTIGWLACYTDPHCFRLLAKRLLCQQVPNASLWGCQSYAPF